MKLAATGPLALATILAAASCDAREPVRVAAREAPARFDGARFARMQQGCDSDGACVVVEHHHCCGSSMATIKRASLAEYEASPELHTFNELSCAVMGPCAPLAGTPVAVCRSGTCVLELQRGP